METEPATLTSTSNWGAMEAERLSREAGWRTGDRFHSSHNLHLVLDGRLIVEGTPWKTIVGPGDVMLIPWGTRYRFRCDREGCRYLILRLRLSAFGLHVDADADAWDLLMALVRQVMRRGPLLTVTDNTRRELRALWRAILREQRNAQRAMRPAIKGAAMTMLAILARDALDDNVSSGTRPPHSYRAMRSVLDYIEQHCDESLPIERLANVAGLSRSHFHAVFRDYTGLTVTEHVTRMRIGRACRLLRETDASVLHVGYRCGFASASRFYEAFRTVVGAPPGKWRKAAPADAAARR